MSKTLPGQIYATDTTTPADTPLPPQAFILETGTVACVTGNATIVGTGTKFTEELIVGQSLLIRNRTVKIESIHDDETLHITAPWPGEHVSGEYAYVYKFRPFAEFLGKYTYSELTPLGVSGLILKDMMPNFKRPMREIDSTATVPSWATDPETTGDPTSDTTSNSSKQPKSKPLPPEIPEV